jgi:acyl carrier protein
MREEICSRVCRAVASVLNLDPSQVNQGSSMDTIPQWDSLAHLKLVLLLEEEFGLTFQMRDTVRMRSIEKICQIIEEINVRT